MIVLLLLGAGHALAQKTAKDWLTARDSLDIVTGESRSPGGYWHMADSCGKAGNRAQAGTYFSKIHPYYLLFLDYTPETISGLFSMFRLPADTVRSYTARFIQACTAEKSASYQRLKAMHDEDQAIRKMRDQCRDSVTCNTLAGRMLQQDTAHFAYLYDYVSKNGWPTIENGSYYAGIIAIHDHAHHQYYLPHLLQAVKQGTAPASLLYLVLYWQRDAVANEQLKALLDTANKISFDVSSMLIDVMPKNVYEIRKLIQQHCPQGDRYLTLQVRDNKVFANWSNTALSSASPTGKVVREFFNILQEGCPEKFHKNVWWVAWLPGENVQPKLMLHVVY